MVSRKYATIAAATAVVLSAPALAFATDSVAAAPRHGFFIKQVLSQRFQGPLQFAIGKRLYVADAFTSELAMGTGKVLARGGNPKTGGDVGGVGLNEAANEVAYTWSGGAHYQTKFVLLRAGKVVFSTNLAAFEGRYNPDGTTHYGVDHPSACVSNALTQAHIPVNYTGEKDSHPYATTYLGNGQWAVADAGANAILKIDTVHGRVATLAVLPPEPYVVTKQFAQASHLPNCVVGVRYKFESVPTDVETGPNGTLYASSLPGGPEGGAPGVPPSGRIFTIAPTGALKLIGSGFASITNIAVGPNGVVYAAELGAGRISRVVNGRPQPVFEHVGTVGVEWANGHLYASFVPILVGVNAKSSIVELGYK